MGSSVVCEVGLNCEIGEAVRSLVSGIAGWQWAVSDKVTEGGVAWQNRGAGAIGR